MRSLLDRPVRNRSSVTAEPLEPRQLLAGMLVDVRQVGTAFGAGKSIAVPEGGTVALGVYLRNINLNSDVSPNALNGLGAFTISLQTFGEKTHSGSKKWPVLPTPTD